MSLGHRRKNATLDQTSLTSLTCSECGEETSLVNDPQRGSLVCASCGIVVESKLPTSGPEYRAYTEAEERTRARIGSPISNLQPDYGLRTEIGRSPVDGKGKPIPASRRTTFKRLSSINSRDDQNEIRNLRTALRELRRMRSQLELSEDVAMLASRLYRKILKADLIRGRSIEGMVATSLYLACRQSDIPMTLKDIASITNVQTKELGRCVRVVLKNLEGGLKIGQASLSALVFRLGESLGMTVFTRRIALKLLEEAKQNQNGITFGKNPMSVAAAALYIAGVQTGERRTQQQIADAAKTTPVTIRNRFKEFVRVLNLEDSLDVKRGAAAVPVYVNPENFAKPVKEKNNLGY